MKKICFFILLLFTIIKVNALVEIDLENPIIRFPKIDDYVLQGFTNVDNKLFMVFIEPSKSKPLIQIYDLDTKKLIKEFYTSDIGHANDVTYNSKENKIYVLHGDGLSLLHVFDGTGFNYLRDIKISLPIRSITYVEDKDLYAVRTISTGFYYNSDFSLKSKLPFIIGMNMSSDVGRQGWTYYDGLIYYSTWSWVRLGGDGTNTIHVYDLGGNKLDTIVTPGGVGELEDVVFYNNKMILGINTYDDFIEFYEFDIPNIDRHVVINEEIVEVTEEKKSFNWFYIIPLVIVILFIVLLCKRKRCK